MKTVGAVVIKKYPKESKYSVKIEGYHVNGKKETPKIGVHFHSFL